MAYYYSEKYGFIYEGTMQEGDRKATKAEVEYWNSYKSTLPKDIKAKLAECNQKYAEALNKPISCQGAFVIADWMSTYSNTYTLAKKIEDAGETVTKNIVVLTAQGKLETVTISSLADFEPYYDAVSNEWARLIDLRNNYLVQIQNSTAPQEIEIEY